jgi:hypothetical protein
MLQGGNFEEHHINNEKEGKKMVKDAITNLGKQKKRVEVQYMYIPTYDTIFNIISCTACVCVCVRVCVYVCVYVDYYEIH